VPLTLSSYPNVKLKGLRFSEEVQQLSLFYRLSRRISHVVICSLWQVRVFGRRYEPDSGGVLYLANHQSFLDPPLLCFGLQRPVNFMAREELFRNRQFARLIRALHAFPVKAGTADIGALKEAMRRLKSGRQVGLFPEGTRSVDGRIGPFLPGAAMLAQRAADWTVPVLIDGAVECWPRTRKLPLPGSIIVQYGQPISQAEAREYDSESFVHMVRGRVTDMQSEIRKRVGQPVFDYSGPQAD